MNNYKNLDDFIDCMGGSELELKNLADISLDIETFVHGLPYPVNPEDPVVVLFWERHQRSR